MAWLYRRNLVNYFVLFRKERIGYGSKIYWKFAASKLKSQTFYVKIGFIEISSKLPVNNKVVKLYKYSSIEYNFKWKI